MAEARERSRSPMSVRWSVSSWKDLLLMKVTEESQLVLVSNALADAEDERWNPPDSSSRAFGLKVIWGSDIYIEFRDHLTCTSDKSLKMFQQAFREFKAEFYNPPTSSAQSSSYTSP